MLGYERLNLRERLLPGSGTSPPTGNDRLRFYLFVLLPWLALYEVILAIGVPPDAISGMTRFEQRLPVLEWTQIIYASTYFLTILAPVFAKNRSDLRNYSVRALWTMLVAYPAFLIIPLIAPKRPFIPHTLPGRLLLWERTLDSPVAAFPSFHVIWAMLAAEVFARRWPRLKGLFYAWAILVAASCVTTSQHSILDVLGGAATVTLVMRTGPVRIVSRAGSGAWLIVAITLILTRLWLLAAPLHLIAGLCFILAGLGRSVEQAWRGKPRPQWRAVASVIAGILLTVLGHSAPAPRPHFAWHTLLPAVALGVAAAIVVAAGYPNLKRRPPLIYVEDRNKLARFFRFRFRRWKTWLVPRQSTSSPAMFSKSR